MAYELVQTEELTASKKQNPKDRRDWDPPEWAKQKEDDWVGEADSGYSDTFRDLKKKLDHTFQLYRDQLERVPLHQQELKKEKRRAWWNVLKFAVVIPASFFLITVFLGGYAVGNDVVDTIYKIFKIVDVPVVILSEFFLLPAAARDLANCQFRSAVLNNPNRYANYREKEHVVTFAEEQHFLRHEIKKIKAFNERIEKEGLDQVGGGEFFVFLDEMTEKQAETLEEMRELSTFKDCQARVGEKRVNAGYEWVTLGFGILFGMLLLIAVFAGIRMSI